MVPDVPDQPMQIIDVRDLAGWIVTSGERGATGTFDGNGPRSTLGAVLDEIAAAVGAPDLVRVPVPVEALTAAGVTPWAGPRQAGLTPAEEHPLLTSCPPSASPRSRHGELVIRAR